MCLIIHMGCSVSWRFHVQLFSMRYSLFILECPPGYPFSVLKIPSLLNVFMWDVPFYLGNSQVIEFFHLGYSIYILEHPFLSCGDSQVIKFFYGRCLFLP